MFRSILFVLLLILVFSEKVSAQSASVSGRIIDAQTSEGLPNANVFIDQTTFGVAADADGNFLFKNIPPGSIVLVFSFVGYKTYQVSLTVEEGKDVNLLIRLQPQLEELSEVEVKGSKDKKWEADLKKFKRYFLGTDDAGSRCIIENPWVLDFSEDSKNGDFLAKASQPLEITNPALGYKVRFILQEFRYAPTYYKIAGNAQFTEIPPVDAREALDQMRQRKTSYLYSDRYFFKSLLEKRLKDNGFSVYIDKPRYESMRTNVFSVEAGKSIIPWTPGNAELARPGIYRIPVPPKIEIHNNQLNSDRRVYKDVNYAISWIDIKGTHVLVNQAGVVMNPGVVVTSGEMNMIRVGRMLPLNYTPDDMVTVAGLRPVIKHERLREKVYLLTDRNFYYPGETIKLKAHMNYGDQLMRDSLSAILYVELLNKSKQLLLTERLQIDSGLAFGKILVPDSLKQGMTYIRAYTNWMRNYGTSAFFVKPLPILSKTVRPVNSQKWAENSEMVSWTYEPAPTSEATAGFFIHVLDTAGEDLPAHLSISITDLKSAPYVSEPTGITKGYPIKTSETIPHQDFTYPIEYAISMKGRAITDSGKPIQGSVTMILGNLEDLHSAQSQADGSFEMDSLFFYDSVKVATQVRNKKGKQEGFVLWQHRDVPFSDFPLVPFNLVTESLTEPVFVPSPGSRLLKQVTITENRPEKSENQPYGKADYVISGDQLMSTKTGASLVNSLQGKVPGMQILTTFGETGIRYKIVMRGGSNTILGSMEPQVYINGVPSTSSDGFASTVLDQINPMDVERVEIITRTNALMGSLGSNGLIAVFTKSGITNGNFNSDGFRVDKMKGLQVLRTELPEVEGFRGTVYWNPAVEIKKGNKGVWIPFKAPYSGQFLVSIQGITSENQPIRSFQLISEP